MNVLCVEQFSNWGGGQRSLLELLPAFCEQGWRPHVVLPEEGPVAEELRNLAYPITFLRSAAYTKVRKSGKEIWRYAQELPRLTRELQEIAVGSNSNLLYVNGPRALAPSAWVAQRNNLPLVFHCHHRLQQSSAILLSGGSLKLCGGYMVASCDYAAKPIAKYLPPKRIFVRYNGVFGPAKPRSRTSTHLRRIGVIGRIEREKGQLEFARAARLLVGQFPGCWFRIVGAPMFSNANYYEEVKAESRGLPIEFVGWQNDISTIFKDLDLVVVPSTPLEATTRVIMEAFAFGVPVVAFRAGGIPEIVEDNETGFLADGSNADALARRIKTVLLMRREDLDEVAAKAFKTWQERFTVEQYRKDICDILFHAYTFGTGN